MDKLGKILEALAKELQPLAIPAVVFGFAIVGLCFLIPNRKIKEFAKDHAVAMIGGAIILLGCVYFATTIIGKITF